MATTQRPMSDAPPTAVVTAEMSTAIVAHLASKGVQPRGEWLHNFLGTARANTPLPALRQTALFRLLATDITTTIQSSPALVFPSGIADPAITELRIPGPIATQVLDVEDIGRSRWSQVEAIEAHERGETTKGREIIRVVPDDTNNGNSGTQAVNNAATSHEKSSGPHKLLLQDAKGTKVYAFELVTVNGINVTMPIGTKLVLRNSAVARGVVLLEPRCVEILGGKVDAWEKKWREERKAVLKAKAGMRETG